MDKKIGETKSRFNLSTSIRIILFLIIFLVIYMLLFRCDQNEKEQFYDYNKKKFLGYNKKKYRDTYKIKQQKRDKYFDKFYYKI